MYAGEVSDTSQQETARYSIRAYHETPEHAALRGEQHPPPEPIGVARQQLALAVREHGEVMDFESVREDERVAVVVDDNGEWRPAMEGETPTGHIVLWSCAAFERQSTDANDPVLDVVEDDEAGGWWATVPEPQASVGGACRIKHRLGGEVTVHAYRADGSGIGYLFATTLDKDTVHVEFFGGTARFFVEAD